MPSKVLAWKCNYCNKVTISAGSTAAHEAYCKKNPKNKFCVTCAKCYYNHVFEESCSEYVTPWEHDVMWCRQYDKPIYEKPYFEECETEDHYECEPTNIPCTCAEYEQNIAQEVNHE